KRLTRCVARRRRPADVRPAAASDVRAIIPPRRAGSQARGPARAAPVPPVPPAPPGIEFAHSPLWPGFGRPDPVASLGQQRGSSRMNRQGVLTLAGVGLASWFAYRRYRSRHGYDFRDKTVLITGGTRGLGLVLARQLARENARLAVCARDPDEVGQAF